MKLKKPLIYILIAFVLYTVITSPYKASNFVHQAISGVSAAGQSVALFFDGLLVP